MHILPKKYDFENEKNVNELTKEYSKAIQGIAVLFMLLLHLFCRRTFSYEVNLYINGVPFVYYIGLWGDQCVALFCFCAGYASYLQQEKFENKKYIKYSSKRLLRLLVNYWIIILLFSIIGILIGKGEIIPGSWMKLIGNLFLFNISYNGAWWFMLTYVILVFLSPILYKFVKKNNGIIVFVVVGVIYFISYLVRFEHVIFPDMGKIINWCITQSALLGTSLLPYIWGMLFYKFKIISRLRAAVKLTEKKKYGLSFIVFGICIVLHGIEESLIIAPIFAIATVCVISLWDGNKIKFLKYVGEHSTNIWLTHMFFYLVVFEDFIFSFKYPILINTAMIVLCLCVSYIVNFLLKQIVMRIKLLNCS